MVLETSWLLPFSFLWILILVLKFMAILKWPLPLAISIGCGHQKQQWFRDPFCSAMNSLACSLWWEVDITGKPELSLGLYLRRYAWPSKRIHLSSCFLTHAPLSTKLPEWSHTFPWFWLSQPLSFFGQLNLGNSHSKNLVSALFYYSECQSAYWLHLQTWARTTLLLAVSSTLWSATPIVINSTNVAYRSPDLLLIHAVQEPWTGLQLSSRWKRI